MFRVLLGSAFALLLAASLARANDSTAELDNSGLVFVKNDKIEMRSEDLFISAKDIRVRYRFFNRSDEDVTAHVAFPVPDLDTEAFGFQDISLPARFVTIANGQAVTVKKEQKAVVKDTGVDLTAVLQKLGIPLAPGDEADAALDRLPKERWTELIDAGLARIEEFDEGKGMETHLRPRWILRTAYYWQQVFPAKAETVIEHQYQPSVGSTVATGLDAPNPRKTESFPEYEKKYCVDQQFVAAIERLRAAAKRQGQDYIRYTEQRIDYILRTGANWAGPIQDFRLVVSKGDADSLISFCGEGVKKISPTEFEMRKTNFWPYKDLHFLILKKYGE